MKHTNLRLPLAALVLLALAACSDDEGGPAPTMATIWPHADGSAWTFELISTLAWSDGVEMPTNLPSLEALHMDLQLPPPGVAAAVDTNLYTFALDGMTTTSAGMPVQAVVNTLEPMGGGSMPFPQVGSQGSMLLGGSAFAFADSGYYRYSTTGPEPRWVYLEGDLRPGTEFSYRQAQDLLPDWWLSGRIWSVGDREIGGQRYRDVVECMYRLDLGDAEYDGGTVRNVLYGVVFYAPGTGPVAWHERSRIMSRTAYDPEGRPSCTDQQAVLVDVVLPPAP